MSLAGGRRGLRADGLAKLDRLTAGRAGGLVFFRVRGFAVEASWV